MIIILSSQLFSGYKIEIDITSLDSHNWKDEVIVLITTSLENLLNMNNLNHLLVELHKSKYHIHDTDFMNLNQSSIIYVCECS